MQLGSPAKAYSSHLYVLLQGRQGPGWGPGEGRGSTCSRTSDKGGALGWVNWVNARTKGAPLVA